MSSYILLLLAASLVVVAVYFFLGKSIPVEPPVYYASVGFSLVLSMALPRFLASLNVFGVIAVYILLIGFFSVGLTVAWEKLLARGQERIPADPGNTYVGKTVGLLTREPDEPAFADVLARHMTGTENSGWEDPSPTQEPPEDQAATGRPRGTHPSGWVGYPPKVGQEPAGLAEPPGPESPVPLPEVTPPVWEEVPCEGPDEVPAADAPPPEEVRVERERPGALRPEDRDRYARELHGLFGELALRPPPGPKARLTLRLSEVYRDLGQYWQAVEVIRTFLAAAANVPDGEVLNALIVNAAYCQAILRTLREGGESSVPHNGLAEGTKARAAALAGRLILQGGWQGEDIAGNP